MSEEELEQDELDGADGTTAKSWPRPTTAKRTAATATRPPPGKKAKAAVVEEELPSVEAKQKKA